MNNKDAIQLVPFSNINLSDSFFDSLRADYKDFDEWFNRKCKEGAKAYTLYDNSTLQAFLYLKDEFDIDNIVSPCLPKKKKLKIGTFKINAHRTALGEKFMTIILRKMIRDSYDLVYVTFFDKQVALKKLFEKFGFRLWGYKGAEKVYFKNKEIKDDVFQDFPRIKFQGVKKHLLGIYPKYHTLLFPDSRLNNEDTAILDTAYANTIEKCYLCSMYKVNEFEKGDLILIYRTTDIDGLAKYRSVVTSVCTLVETANINDFSSYSEFEKYVGKGTIFTKPELKYFFENKKYPYILKMIYNFPLEKKVIRNTLIEDIGLDSSEYYGTLDVTNSQFKKILKYGDVDASFIID